MRRTPKQQLAGIVRLNNAFGGITAIVDRPKKRRPRRRRNHLRRRILLKYGGA